MDNIIRENRRKDKRNKKKLVTGVLAVVTLPFIGANVYRIGSHFTLRNKNICSATEFFLIQMA